MPLRALRSLPALLLVLVLTGCGTAGLIRRGDALMVANRPDQALEYYQRALRRDAELANDPDFPAKLRRAQSLVHFNAAHAMARRSEWDDAVRLFEQSAAADTTFAEARTALAWAKAQGASAWHTRGLGLADQGRLDQATAALRHALTFVPDHPASRAALASVGRGTPGSRSPAEPLFTQANALATKKHWGQAAQALDAAVAADPNHLPSRTARAQARGQMSAAQQQYAQGDRLLGQKRLDQAQTRLRAALAIWPTYPEATNALARATTLRKQAEDRYAAARTMADKQRWDDAAAQAKAALDIFPYHPQARALLEAVAQQAAATHVEAGRNHLARRELAEAEASFLQALHYVPGLSAANQGLSEADYARGLDAEKQGRPGNALVWYLLAADHFPAPVYNDRATAARNAVFARARFGIAVQVHDAYGRTTPATESLAAAIAGRVSRSAPDAVFLTPIGKGGSRTDYLAATRLLQATADTRAIRSESRIHPYTVRRRVANPERPKLQRLLWAAERDFRDAQHEYSRRCRHCRGKGRVACSRCEGSGKIQCPTCEGKGKRPCPMCKGTGKIGNKKCLACRATGFRPCKTCKGTGKVECPKCDGRGTRKCSHCKGTGRAGSISHSELRRFERRVLDLRQRLRLEPDTVLADFPAEWPYTIHTYRTSGFAEATLQIIETAGNTVVHTDRLRKSQDHDDVTVDHPNPELGLPADPLVLPSEDSVRRAVLDDLANGAASTLLSAILNARITALRNRSEQFRRQGREADSIEAMVELARVLQNVSTEESDQIITQLKTRIRTHN